VEWAGEDIVGRPDAIRPMRRRYQKLHQEPAAAFIPGLPLRRQFEALRLVVPGFDASRALPELLDRLKLRHALIDRRPEELSGGEAQRMSLARVLALDPHVIVADEPTSRLDPVVQRETMALLREQVEARGISVVMVSHDASLLRAVADETISLARAPGVPA
jgi:peptide/nickel transport system ATP-binding protein